MEGVRILIRELWAKRPCFAKLSEATNCLISKGFSLDRPTLGEVRFLGEGVLFKIEGVIFKIVLLVSQSLLWIVIVCLLSVREAFAGAQLTLTLLFCFFDFLRHVLLVFAYCLSVCDSPDPRQGPESPFPGKEGFGVQKPPFSLALTRPGKGGVFCQKIPIFPVFPCRKKGIF